MSCIAERLSLRRRPPPALAVLTNTNTYGGCFMLNKFAAALRMALAGALIMSPLDHRAGEKGKFQGHAVLEVTKYTEYKTMEGHPMKSVSAGEMDGLIFHNGGGRA